ncbi:MAG: hypothetical protein IIB76_11435 [Proteobacteria bacterium]|nr:hypothetical protein [Pseudomonadota bacterium]
MKSLAVMQKRKAPLARNVLGLFIVVWLNMALQPCAMAFGGAGDHDCTHCPPTHSGELAAHSAHDMEHAAPVTAPCETSASQCALVDDFNYDGRSAKVKDAPSDVPVAIVPSSSGILTESRSIRYSVLGERSCLPSSLLPLNVLYCVYLI